jgi:hypothetical protein
LIKGNSIAELCWETENPYNYIQRAKERKAEEDSTERREERKSETLHPFNLPLFSLFSSLPTWTWISRKPDGTRKE